MSNLSGETVWPEVPAVPPVRRSPAEVYYPESDGKPMAETEPHANLMIDLRVKLEGRYRDEPLVHIGGNLLLYYVEGDPKRCVSPDVYVTFGLNKTPLRTYKLWVEGRPPDVIFEATSLSTKKQDLHEKRDLYARFGVSEYFLVDPLGEYLDPPARGFRLVEGEYEPIPGPELVSRVLGLRLVWQSGELRLYDLETGAEQLGMVALAKRAEQAHLAWQEAEQRADRERSAREELERQLRELKGKLAPRRES